MPSSPVLTALRRATADVHHALEVEGGVEARLEDGATRLDAVSRFLSLHVAVSQAVAPWAAAISAHGYPVRDRSTMIRRDLSRLDEDGRAGPARQKTSGVASLGEAFGWLYVAEGSMLGGRVMRRAMTARGADLTGLDFLDPWGDETGDRWRAFLLAMESVCASGRALQADVLKGGCDAFDLARRLLISPRPIEPTA